MSEPAPSHSELDYSGLNYSAGVWVRGSSRAGLHAFSNSSGVPGSIRSVATRTYATCTSRLLCRALKW
ncbi:hypothetical protein [Streptomyces sp. NPDC059176]|uniref:hypothetical protein n=1 Tax=unclassified Streptomyces TaxID=2593676 RepID=UPI00367B097A